MKTITAGNSVYALAITGLYPSPQVLAGYAADDGFTTEAIDIAEVVMGLDGKMSAGKIFSPVKQIITLMPDSDSLDIFNTWYLAMKAAREVLFASASISLPAIGKKYVLEKGVMTQGKPIPDVKKLLTQVTYTITWESVVGANI